MNLIQERSVRILRTKDDPLPFKKAKQVCEHKGYRLISNRLADTLLHSYVRMSLPTIFWTGTIVAYPRAGEAFGSIVHYQDPHSGTRYVLEVPKGFVGVKDSALVMMPDTYNLEYNRRTFWEYFALVPPVLVPHFPNISVGSFGSHRITQIPVEGGEGKKRELWRTLGSEYVGPIVRMHADHEGENWRDNVYICLPPSNPLPVVAEEIRKVA